MSFFYHIMKSPIGNLHLIADAENLCAVAYDSNISALKKYFPELQEKENSVLKKTQKQLQEYFEGRRQQFDIPLKLTHGTEFQKRTWQALSQIPYGKTVSYQEQAEKLRKPSAVRAVGRTNGLNPISIIVPCHRVIAKSGNLTGYAGGLPAKKFLLELEKDMADKKSK